MKPVFIMRHSAMGDVAIACEVIESIAMAYPQQKFIFMTDERFAALMPKVDNVIVEALPIKKYHSIKEVIQLAIEMTTRWEFEKVIDLNDKLRTKIMRIVFQLKSKRIFVVDKQRIRRFIKFYVRSKRYMELQHISEMMSDAFAKAGYPLSIKDSKLNDKIASNVLANKQQFKSINIGIACFSSKTVKEYSMQRIVQLIDLLQNNKSILVYLFGKGEREKQLSDEICRLTNCNSFVNDAEMEQDIENVRKMDLIISVDTGWMHIASMIGKPVISLWGPTQPSCGYYPLHQQRDMAISLQLPCSPCSVYGKKQCKYNDCRCMAILPEEIYKLVMNIIADTVGSGKSIP